MTATSRPTMTLTYSRPAPGERATGVSAVIDPADGSKTVRIDLELSDFLVRAVTQVAEAFGAQVVEATEYMQQPKLAELSVVDPEDRRFRRLKAQREEFLSHCRRATAADYQAWLDGWVAQGGQVSHSYDYDLGSSWWVLESPAGLPPMHGALSVNVIVPQGVEIFIGRGHTHNHVFFMGGGVAGDRGSRWVPTYRNVRVRG